ncbi:MAG: M20 family metallo-hydrolase [Bacteroidales bacterium]
MDTDIAHYEAIDLLKKMIETPSVSRNEEQVADLIEKYIRQKGIDTHRKGNNIWTVSPDFDPEKPTILLNSHIDTVKPAISWTLNPFEPVEEEGEIIYGLGSNDAGASVVSLLHSFLMLTEKEQPYNLIFLASAEEEVSGKNGIECILPELPEISFAVVGEPTGMHAAIAEKGLMVIDVTVHGKSGHAARNEGVNAIYEALPVMCALRDFRFPLESQLLGAVKVSLTQVNAGTQHNVVPDCCSFVLDVRTNELYSNEEAFELIRNAALSAFTNAKLPENTEEGKNSEEVKNSEEIKSKEEINNLLEIKARSFRLNSSRIEPEHPFIRRVRIMDRNLFGSPTLSDQALMPFPSVKMGPGDSARSHTANEFIRRSEIREAIAIYVKLLDGIDLVKDKKYGI